MLFAKKKVNCKEISVSYVNHLKDFLVSTGEQPSVDGGAPPVLPRQGWNDGGRWAASPPAEDSDDEFDWTKPEDAQPPASTGELDRCAFFPPCTPPLNRTIFSIISSENFWMFSFVHLSIQGKKCHFEVVGSAFLEGNA